MSVSACPACAVEIVDSGRKFCRHCGHDLAKAPGLQDVDGLIGQTVDGRYRVVERIGAGGMGVVYRVEHVRMGKIAAMKVLRRDLVDDGQAVKRFRREVEAVSRLEHPNIIQTFDYGEWHGLSYLVMEYIRGEDLYAIIKREGPMPVARALPLFAQVCAALEEAHELGIVHRDLKPDNIVCLRRRNQVEMVKVLDFGLAKLRERPGLAEVTGAGSLIGTPYYMSPEQVRAENTDQRSDIYSLGATMYRVITATPPFQGDTPMAILAKHLTDEVQPPSQRCPEANIPAEVDEIVLRAMAKSQHDRFATAAEMRAAIEAACGLAPSAILPAIEDRPMAPDVLSDGVIPSASLVSSTGPSPSEASAETLLDPSDANKKDDEFNVDFDSVREGRLRREDVDVFEKKLRRRKRGSFFFATLVLAALAGGGYYAQQRTRENAGPTEHEPNNTAAAANLVANAEPLYGQIGDPQFDGTPDMDYFKVPIGKRRQMVTIHVTAVPEIDLLIEVFSGSGELLARRDAGKIGQAESMGTLLVGPLDVYVRVRAVWVEGEAHPQSETPYALTVGWQP